MSLTVILKRVPPLVYIAGLLLTLLLALVGVIAGSFVLNLASLNCATPLQTFLIGSLVLCYLWLLGVGFVLLSPSAGKIKLGILLILQGAYTLAALIWNIVGSVWVGSAGTCSTTTPELYQYCLAFIIIFWIVFGVPFLVLLGMLISELAWPTAVRAPAAAGDTDAAAAAGASEGKTEEE
eukprot:PLAT5590.1.p1 GENE.PLAT5590.1~~PLAT5590.1.p1  ORF type:complete len:180 (-),score=42.35 PLAT5590.1:112-651(-)